MRPSGPTSRRSPPADELAGGPAGPGLPFQRSGRDAMIPPVRRSEGRESHPLASPPRLEPHLSATDRRPADWARLHGGFDDDETARSLAVRGVGAEPARGMSIAGFRRLEDERLHR